MLSSISPVGEHARRQRWGITATAYLLGSMVGGAAVGTLAGGIGQLTLSAMDPAVRGAGVGVVALIGLVLDATGRVPSLHRQVDERWLTAYRGWVYGGGFGLQLGTGVATIIPSSVVWVMWAGAALTASVNHGALVGVVFGGVRALPLLLAARIRTVGALRRALARLDRVRTPMARVVPAVQGCLGLAVLGIVLLSTT